ncbi:hypothetical protein GQ600_16069 [Phytophthora cactorum]|nr:hypothetical protein GQ600_16069 [Phytophthora cactorum]
MLYDTDSVSAEVSTHTTQQPDIRVTRGGDERDGGDGESKEEVPAEVILQSTVDISGGAEDERNCSQDDNEKYSVLESGNESEEEYPSELDVSDTDSGGSGSVDEDDDELYAKEERHVADHFLDPTGGVEKMIAGQVMCKISRLLAGMNQRYLTKKMKIKPMTHIQYIYKLHMQLITITADEMYEANTFQPAEEAPTDAAPVAPYTQVLEAESSGHLAKQSEEWRDHSGQRKLFQKNGKTMLSCWDIWHKEFKNGTAIPDELKRRIRVRSMKNAGSPGKSPAKRRRVDAE